MKTSESEKSEGRSFSVSFESRSGRDRRPYFLVPQTYFGDTSRSARKTRTIQERINYYVENGITNFRQRMFR